MTQNAFLLFFATGFFLPYLVDLVTKKVAEPRFKSLALLVLSLVASGITDYFNSPTTFTLAAFGFAFATTFLSAVATLFGFAKPVGLSGKSGLIAKTVPGGFGPVGVQVLTTETVSTHNLSTVKDK